MDDILAELGVTAEDCLWTLTEGYEPVPHSVFREDDNGHRSLVGEFPSRIDALLKIEDPVLEAPAFHGWMIASSPALSALEHSRYDVWVIRCRSV